MSTESSHLSLTSAESDTVPSNSLNDTSEQAANQNPPATETLYNPDRSSFMVTMYSEPAPSSYQNAASPHDTASTANELETSSTSAMHPSSSTLLSNPHHGHMMLYMMPWVVVAGAVFPVLTEPSQMHQLHGHSTHIEFQDSISDNDFDDFEDDDLDFSETWSPAAYVDTLEKVDISTIAPADMNCPHCWLPFSTTGEIDSPAVLAYLSEEEREETARLTAIHEMPFCENKPNNDPVRTPCEYVFGKQCLVESLESSTTCPMCRRELRE